MRATTTQKENDKQGQAQAEFVRMVEKVCRSGFYGTGSITINIQDGHVQYTRVVVDRMVR